MIAATGLFERFANFRLAAALALAFVAAPACCLSPASAAEGADGANNTDESNPHLWKTKTTSVAVFKNGLGFFMREGDVRLRDGWCLARQIPPATFGTLAIYSLNKDELVDVVGSGPGEVVDFDGQDAPTDAESKLARLSACKQLSVQLNYKQHGSDRSAAGKLVSVGPEFVVLENETNSFAVPLAGISRLQVLDLPLRVHVSSDAAEPADDVRLGMAYLRKGIVWIPEYTMQVIDETTAELTLRGTLVNEAEDLVHCDVHLVVGVPHFLHTDYLAPIAVGQVIRTIGAGVAPEELRSQIMNRAGIVSNSATAAQFDNAQGVVQVPADAGAGDVGAVLGNLPQLEGAAATDYTVYTTQDLTLRQGEKAIITLFKKKITYSHVYRWSLPQPMQHFLVLQNETDTAWTTGPCLAVSADRPLSEDLLLYTPRGGHSELPVTSAVNIAHDKSEEEIDRKLKAHNPTQDYFLDLVTLQGTLKLRNFEKRPVEIVIETPVPGKPTSASDEGEMSTDPTQLKLLDRAGTIRWRVKLDPGQTATRTYQYERFVPSN